jgi:hypothetical protein
MDYLAGRYFSSTQTLDLRIDFVNIVRGGASFATPRDELRRPASWIVSHGIRAIRSASLETTLERFSLSAAASHPPFTRYLPPRAHSRVR